MKGKRHSEEQIIAILKQSEAGMKKTEVCRQAGISEQPFYCWKAKYESWEPPTRSGWSSSTTTAYSGCMRAGQRGSRQRGFPPAVMGERATSSRLSDRTRLARKQWIGARGDLGMRFSVQLRWKKLWLP